MKKNINQYNEASRVRNGEIKWWTAELILVNEAIRAIDRLNPEDTDVLLVEEFCGMRTMLEAVKIRLRKKLELKYESQWYMKGLDQIRNCLKKWGEK